MCKEVFVVRSIQIIQCSDFFQMLRSISQRQYGGSGMFIPDPTFFHPGTRIRTVSIHVKNMIRVVRPGSGCWLSPIPDPRSRGQKGTQSRIRIRNTGQRDGTGFGSGSFQNQAKVVRFLLLSDFFDNDVNVPSKSHKQKNIVFCCYLSCWH